MERIDVYDDNRVGMIVSAVLRQLENSRPVTVIQKILLFGREDCPYTQFTVSRLMERKIVCVFAKDRREDDAMDHYTRLAIPFLRAENIPRLAAGTAFNSFEKAVLSAVMQNRSIHVLYNELDQIKADCNPVFYQKLAADCAVLETYGIHNTPLEDFLRVDEASLKPELRVSDWTHKRLIAEKDILALEKGEEILVHNPIVTPLAADAIKEKQIHMVYKNLG